MIDKFTRVTRPDMSLAVVGGLFANRDGGNRLFEIALCLPGEHVQLVCEPRNPHDPSAVAVFSARGTQLGYLSAERCGWMGARIALGEDIQAIFQRADRGSAIIRVSFIGAPPSLAALPPQVHATKPQRALQGDDFYPDDEPIDDWN